MHPGGGPADGHVPPGQSGPPSVRQTPHLKVALPGNFPEASEATRRENPFSSALRESVTL